MGDMVLQAPLLHLLHYRYGRPCGLLSFGGWSHPLYAGSADVGTICELRLRHAPYLLSPQRWMLVRALKRHDGPVYVSEDIPGHVGRIRDLLARARVLAQIAVCSSRIAIGSRTATGSIVCSLSVA